MSKFRTILRSIPIDVIAIAVVAFTFFAVASWWGAPYATAEILVKSWGVDDESPLGPLAEIHNILEPKDDQWLSYPLLYSFITAAAYSPYMAFLFLTGGLTSPSAAYPFGFSDPVGSLRVLTQIAHLVSVTMGTTTVVCAYLIGTTLAARATGLLYAMLVLVSFPLIYYARNGNVDATALAFAALAVCVFASISVRGYSKKRAVWLGVFAGLSLGAKESMVGVFLMMPVILIFLQTRGGPALRWRTFAAYSGLGLLAAFLSFGLGSGLFVDPKRYFDHLAYLRELRSILASSDTLVLNTYPFDLSGNLGYLAAMFGNILSAIYIPGAIAVSIGVACAIRDRSVAMIPFVLAVGYFIFIFFSYRLAQIRFLLPIFFLLLFYVPYISQSVSKGISRGLAHSLTALTCGLMALAAVDFTYQMLFDSRYEAGRWLKSRVEAGDTISYFGAPEKLPPVEAGVLTRMATEDFGLYSTPVVTDAKAQEILDGWRADPPAYVLIIPDHTSPPGVPYSHSVPSQLFEKLESGESAFRPAAIFATPELFPWLNKPKLDYPSVNPPIRIFEPVK